MSKALPGEWAPGTGWKMTSGQMVGQMVDSVAPKGQRQDTDAMTAIETNKTYGLSNTEGVAEEVRKSRQKPHACEERRRDLYRL